MEVKEKVSQLQLAHWQKLLWELWGTTLEALLSVFREGWFPVTQRWCKHLCLSSILPSITTHPSSIHPSGQAKFAWHCLLVVTALTRLVRRFTEASFWQKTRKNIVCSCGSVGRAGCSVTQGLVVIMVVPLLLLLCPCARHWIIFLSKWECMAAAPLVCWCWVRGLCKVLWGGAMALDKCSPFISFWILHVNCFTAICWWFSLFCFFQTSAIFFL